MTDSQRKDGEELCGEYVTHLIAGSSYYPCALPKGHKEEGHRAGGTCVAHGSYLGGIGVPPCCPKWPDCVKDILTPSPPAASLDGREEFEKWAKESHGTRWDFEYIDAGPGTYTDTFTQYAWQGWQASRASDRERVEELERELAETASRLECAEGLSADDLAHMGIEVIELGPTQGRRDTRFRNLRAESAESRVEQLQRANAALTELLRRLKKIASTDNLPLVGIREIRAALRSHIEGK